MKIYLVGGAVRDGLLGLTVKDHDWVVVHGTPEQMLADHFIAVGKDFPVFLHPKTHEEYALARTERKTGSGYHGFDCFFSEEVTIEEDLSRRDLTINAIAFDFDLFQKDHPNEKIPSMALSKLRSDLREQSLCPSQYLVDPYDGLADLLNKSLRHVSIAFKEDPLRVLRLARFYAQFYDLGFQIHPSTSALIDEMISEQELTTLTKERVWQETVKALSTSAPNVYFKFLADHHALKQIFPTLYKGITPIALKRLAHIAQKTQCLKVRFSLLLADINEYTDPKLLKDRKTFNRFFDELRISNEFKSLIWISMHHSYWNNLLINTSEDLLSLLLSLNVLRQPENLEHFIQICTAITEIEENTDNHNVMKTNSLKSNLLRCALQALMHLDIEEIIAQGLPGPEIKLAITNAQLEAIQKVKISPINN